jgi:uncharacterized protein
MLKLLLTVVVVVVALMFWFGKGRPARGGRTARPATPPPTPQPMAACERCGVHLPRSDAFIDDAGRLFCGAEHRRLGPTGRKSP